MSLRLPSLHQNEPLSRREVLKLGGLGTAGLFLAPLTDFQNLVPDQQGRVIDERASVYDLPSFNAKKVKDYWKDMVFPITEVTIGDVEPAFNRIWYRVRQEGYVHSGGIQPVKTQLNQPVSELPAQGALAEVTVPYTDAHHGASKVFPVAYRYYYETTHWIIGLVYNQQGEPWYHILEDKWENEFYAPATHFRIIPSEELTPLSPNIPGAGKRLEVRTTEQAVIAYEWDRPVFMTRTATGARFSNGNFATPAGHMAAGNLAFNGYDLPGVPWISYFTESGISFHGTYWHNNYGRPRSHGCVNLTPKAAKWIYRWTLPIVPPSEQDVYEDFGTAVDVI
jgi:lipoprotein-anchoring transpeptidase ErfK/SrfK